MEPVRHPVRQLHPRHRAGGDIGGVEHGEIAAVVAAAPDHGEQPAAAFRGVAVAGDEYRLGNAVADRQLIVAACLRASACDGTRERYD